jgi:transposase
MLTPVAYVPCVCPRHRRIEEEPTFVYTKASEVLSRLLPDATTLHLEAWHVDDAAMQITLLVSSTQAIVPCPLCDMPTYHIHSRYARTLADLPWANYRVRLYLLVRKFFCRNAACSRRIFTERLPTVAAPWARQTTRLARRLIAMGVALGGEAGNKLALQLGMRVSPDMLLQRVRSSRCLAQPVSRVLGVDDWAFHKGHRYGTILVDLERRKPIDLLPDREPATLAAWLKTHPGVQLITRDRAAKYAEGAREGAPHAVQVADRWHLLKNLREAVQRFLTRQHAWLEQATARVTQCQLLEHTTTAGPVAMLSSRSAKEIQHNRAKRHARYCQVLELHHQGVSQQKIATTLGMSPITVRTFIRAGTFPERATYRRQSQLDPYVAFLHQRWVAGCKHPMQLWHEIVAQGYPGTPRMVRRYVERLGQRLKPLTPEQRTQVLQAETTFKTPSVRQASFWLLKPSQERTSDQEAFITQLCTLSTEIKEVCELSHAFEQMLRERQAGGLATWLENAEQSAVSELRSFATGLRQDEAAVTAALAYDWSNGQVEGQINKLKLLKRQMYGRAKLDLLKARFLAAA